VRGGGNQKKTRSRTGACRRRGGKGRKLLLAGFPTPGRKGGEGALVVVRRRKEQSSAVRGRISALLRRRKKGRKVCEYLSDERKKREGGKGKNFLKNFLEKKNTKGSFLSFERGGRKRERRCEGRSCAEKGRRGGCSLAFSSAVEKLHLSFTLKSKMKEKGRKKQRPFEIRERKEGSPASTDRGKKGPILSGEGH